MSSSRRATAFLPLFSILLSWCSYSRGAWSERDTGVDVGFMVYGESLVADVESGLSIRLLTGVEKDASEPSTGGYALVGYLGRYTGASEPVNLTGREPIGGFPEIRGGGVWLRYWTSEEFYIPERKVDGTFMVPWVYEYEEDLLIPRFLLDEGKEEKNSLCLILAYISPSAYEEPTKSYFCQESSVLIDFRWVGEDEIEILPD